MQQLLLLHYVCLSALLQDNSGKLAPERQNHSQYLYLPSERGETGGYTVFTFLCWCVSVSTQSSLQH